MTTVTPAPDQSDGEDELGLLPIAALESAVNATIRQVGAPSLREAHEEHLPDDHRKPRRPNPPITRPGRTRLRVKVITVTAACDVCVAVLEAIPELAERNRIKDDNHGPQRPGTALSLARAEAMTTSPGDAGR